MGFSGESFPANKKPRDGSGSATPTSGSESLHKASPAKSADSDPAYSTSKAVDLLLVSAKYSHEGVSFEIEKEARPDAAVTGATGSTQGDHVTAYISFLEFLFNITNDRPLIEVSDHLIDIAKSILASDKQQQIFDNLKQGFDKEISQYCPREQRKKLTAKLRAEKSSPTPQEEQELNRLKLSLKLAENTLVGQFVQNLGRGFIRQINLAENIAFAKQGKTDPQEGSRVKQAVYALRLINELQQIEEFKKAISPSYTTDALQIRLLNTQSNLIQRVNEPNSELKQGLKRILETDPELIVEKTKIEQVKQSSKEALREKIKQELKDGKTLKGTVDEEVEKRTLDQLKQTFSRTLDAKITRITDVSSGEAPLFSLLKDRKSDLPKNYWRKIREFV